MFVQSKLELEEEGRVEKQKKKRKGMKLEATMN
jgi:hypothetical protein